MFDLKVQNFVNKEEISCPHTATLREVFETMKEHESGYVLLFKDNAPAGIITERDLVKLIANGVSLEEVAYKYASKELISIKGYRDIYYALSLMVENSVRRLLVKDEWDRFIGTVEMEKILSKVEEDYFRKKIKVKDLLSDRNLIAVREDTSLFECLRLMKDNNVGALPVLREGKPVGIITERDIVKLFDVMEFSEPVKNYMSSPVVTVDENTLVETALRIMEEKRIRRLVVVEDGGLAVGLINNRDLARNVHEGYLKMLELKLKHAKDVLNLLPEPTLEVIDVYTEQLIVWMNARAMEVFGNLIDNPVISIVPEKEWAYIYSGLLKDGKVERYKFHAEEKVYELSASYVQVETDRVRGRIKMVVRDITQDVHSQRAIARELDNYKRIINSTDDMIILYEAKSGAIKVVNASTIRKLGYTEDELKRMTIFQIVQEDPEFIRRNIDRIVRRDETIRGRRTYKDAYGNTIPVEISATKVHMNHEPYILILARDISERLKLEEEINKKTREMENLHAFILNLNRCASEGEAYNLLAHMLLKVVNVDTLAIYKVNPSLNKVVDRLIYGNREYVPCIEESQDPTTCKVFHSVQPFLVKDRNAYSCPMFFVFEYGSYLCMSVVSGGRTIALLNMISRQEGFFDRDKLEFIENIVHTFSPFLSNLRLIEINKELSIRDPLTNLYNRRFVIEFFQKEIEKVKRTQSTMSLMLIDLDHFKKINDTYGHSIGDMCLKVFSEVLSSSVRSMDVVGRWGGEEFIALLPQASREEAVSVANRIRKRLREKVIYVDNSEPIFLTASFGIAVSPEDGEDMDKLLTVADDKLYRAKNEGRDRIIP